MFGFLQGFAYGLFVSCIPWFFIGMARPDLAVPTEKPGRLQVVFRYWLLLPFVSFLLWLTSLWGGFGPSLSGWLAGLSAVAVAVPLERRWRIWRQRRLERAREREEERGRAPRYEANLRTLEPGRLPVNAPPLVREMAQCKSELQTLGRPDLAIQVDRLYTRYAHVEALLDERFQPQELAYGRAAALVDGVCRAAVRTLEQMLTLSRSTAGIDPDYVKRRLAEDGDDRAALERRLELLRETEERLRVLHARHEEAITALDHSAVALSRLETARTPNALAAGRALEELRQFIDKADRYGKVADD